MWTQSSRSSKCHQILLSFRRFLHRSWRSLSDCLFCEVFDCWECIGHWSRISNRARKCTYRQGKVYSSICIHDHFDHLLLSSTSWRADSSSYALFFHKGQRLIISRERNLLPWFCCPRWCSIEEGEVCFTIVLLHLYHQRSKLHPKLHHWVFMRRHLDSCSLVSSLLGHCNMHFVWKAKMINLLLGVKTSRWIVSPDKAPHSRKIHFHTHHHKQSWSHHKCRPRDLFLERQRTLLFSKHQKYDWWYQTLQLEMCILLLTVFC